MLKHIARIQTRTAQLRNERGATAVEYGLMVALIAVAILASVGLAGGALSAMFAHIARDCLGAGSVSC